MAKMLLLRFSLIISLLGLATPFGLESASPIIHDLQTHVPLVHQTAAAVFSTHASAQKEMLQSMPPINPVCNLLSSSELVANANDGDSSMAVAEAASSLLKNYREALDANPLRTKITTGCVLAIIGDAIAQSGQPEEYNKKRAAAFVMFDAVWRTVQQVTYGPIIQTCNGKFSSALLASLPLANMQDQLLKDDNIVVMGAIEQTLVSQLVLIPLLYYPVFYFVTGIVQSLTIEETITRAKETFIPLMKRNLLFWIPVQFCAFYFVEENLQIPVLTACGLVWTIILSLSAGNVNSSSLSEKESTMDGSAVEAKMVLESGGVAGGMVGLPGSSFYYGSNVTAYGDSSDGNTTGSAIASTETTDNKVGTTQK